MESRFRYQVTPFSPIKDLIPGQSLRRPFTSDLTKDEVLLCMKHGPVSRLFPGKLPIKVTGSNIDSLHKKDFESDFVDVAPKDTGNDEKIGIEHSEVSEESKTEVPTASNLDENNVATENEAENASVMENDQYTHEESLVSPEDEEDVVDEQEVVEEEPQVEEEQIEESTPTEEPEEAHVDSSADIAQESQEEIDDNIEAEAVEDEEGETLSVEEEEDEVEDEESESETPVSANNYQQNRNRKKKRH